MKVNPSTLSVAWFNDQNSDKVLHLKPPYQRKPVWREEQKAYLMDTIIRGYFIPEIFIHRETDRHGKSIYNVVDGQQRIRSILEFIFGEFHLSEEYSPEYPNYYFDDLPDDIKIHIWNYTLFVREITEATEDEVRSVFRRMNKNVVSLNAQELRHATYSGEFIKLMEEIAEDEYWAENKIVSAKEIRRMTDVQYISDLFISMLNGIQDKTKEMDHYYSFYEKKFENKVEQYNKFIIIKKFIAELYPDIKLTRWKNKSDYYTLFNVVNELYPNIRKLELKQKRIILFLDKFAKSLSDASLPNTKKKFDRSVTDYLKAVTKSTTDKDRRLIRHKIILKGIKSLI